jgi:hypothetical protein
MVELISFRRFPDHPRGGLVHVLARLSFGWFRLGFWSRFLFRSHAQSLTPFRKLWNPSCTTTKHVHPAVVVVEYGWRIRSSEDDLR